MYMNDSILIYWPATSTDAERAFSCGRLTISRLRHSLNDESVRANTLLGSWSAVPALVSEPEILVKLGGKERRSRAQSAAPATTIDLTEDGDDRPSASISGTTSKGKDAAKASKARTGQPVKKTVYRRKSNASSSDVMEIESEDED